MTDESYQKVMSEIESMTAEDIEKLSKKATEMKSCPFCGGKVDIQGGSFMEPVIDQNGAYVDMEYHDGWGFEIFCNNCLLTMSEHYLAYDNPLVAEFDGDYEESTKEYLIRRWNNRRSGA